MSDEESYPAEMAEMFLGHAPHSNTYAKHYQDPLINVNLQASMAGEEDSTNVAQFRRVHRVDDAPIVLSSKVLQSVKRDPVLLNLEFKKRESRRHKLMKAAWTYERQCWFKNAEKRQTPRQLVNVDTKIPNSIERFGDLRRRPARASVVLRYNEDRALVAEAVRKQEHQLRSIGGISTASALTRIARESHKTSLYFKGEKELINISNNSCNHCGISFNRYVLVFSRQCDIAADFYRTLSGISNSEHIHHCTSHRKLQKQGGFRRRPRHCRRCDLWFEDSKQFKGHCQDHFYEIDMFCGILEIGGLVAAGGRCPFCIADSVYTWDQRMSEFIQGSLFEEHLRLHFLERLDYHFIACPHPLCLSRMSMSMEDLLHHFYDDHGITDVANLLSNMGEPPPITLLDSKEEELEGDEDDDSSNSDSDGVEVPTTTKPDSHAPNMAVARSKSPITTCLPPSTPLEMDAVHSAYEISTRTECTHAVGEAGLNGSASHSLGQHDSTVTAKHDVETRLNSATPGADSGNKENHGTEEMGCETGTVANIVNGSDNEGGCKKSGYIRKPGNRSLGGFGDCNAKKSTHDSVKFTTKPLTHSHNASAKNKSPPQTVQTSASKDLTTSGKLFSKRRKRTTILQENWKQVKRARLNMSEAELLKEQEALFQAASTTTCTHTEPIGQKIAPPATEKPSNIVQSSVALAGAQQASQSEQAHGTIMHDFPQSVLDQNETSSVTELPGSNEIVPNSIAPEAAMPLDWTLPQNDPDCTILSWAPVEISAPIHNDVTSNLSQLTDTSSSGNLLAPDPDVQCTNELLDVLALEKSIWQSDVGS